MKDLLLPYPVSANRYWKIFAIGKRFMRAPTKEANAYKAAVLGIARAAGIKKPLSSWVTVSMVLHPVEPKDAAARARKIGPSWHLSCRCLDVDNAVKVALDAMEGTVYVNDAQVFALSVRRGLPVPGGGLTLSIEEPDLGDVVQSPQLALPVEEEDYDPMAMPA